MRIDNANFERFNVLTIVATSVSLRVADREHDDSPWYLRRVPVSSLLTLGAVHHNLIEERQRMKVGLIVETAEAREVHQICLLLGYGADAICPYLVFEMARNLRADGVLDSALTDNALCAVGSQ